MAGNNNIRAPQKNLAVGAHNPPPPGTVIAPRFMKKE